MDKIKGVLVVLEARNRVVLMLLRQINCTNQSELCSKSEILFMMNTENERVKE